MSCWNLSGVIIWIVLQKCRERLRTKDPKWSDPSPDPAQAGATVPGLSLFMACIDKYCILYLEIELVVFVRGCQWGLMVFIPPNNIHWLWVWLNLKDILFLLGNRKYVSEIHLPSQTGMIAIVGSHKPSWGSICPIFIWQIDYERRLSNVIR